MTVEPGEIGAELRVFVYCVMVRREAWNADLDGVFATRGGADERAAVLGREHGPLRVQVWEMEVQPSPLALRLANTLCDLCTHYSLPPGVPIPHCNGMTDRPGKGGGDLGFRCACTCRDAPLPGRIVDEK